ncbi:MAG: hypothetical protein KC609_00495 [Myxococcales bacterium]|nr:hypothetical protein [Myxococcales bacterium]
MALQREIDRPELQVVALSCATARDAVDSPTRATARDADLSPVGAGRRVGAQTLGRTPPLVGDRAFALDAAVIAVVSVLICFFSQRLLLMSLAVPAVIALRFGLFARLPLAERALPLGHEALFFLGCTLLGGFNDWNSVVNHRIYDYTVPHYFPSVSTIPLWMLLFWGMILRFLVTLFRYRRLDPPVTVRDEIHLGRRIWRNGWLRIALFLALVALTRQMIYRYFLDPWLSWLPFVAALALYVALVRPSRYDLKLLALFAVGGPAIEILYIQVGGLHAYHLGWLAGVPLWIACWWLLVIPLWNDVSGRILARITPPRPGH